MLKLPCGLSALRELGQLFLEWGGPFEGSHHLFVWWVVVKMWVCLALNPPVRWVGEKMLLSLGLALAVYLRLSMGPSTHLWSS